MKFDDIVEELGEFGPYQKRMYFLVCLVAIPHAMQTLGVLFTMGSQDHRCPIPGLPNDTYASQGQWHSDAIKKWIPIDEDEDNMYSSCRVFVTDPISKGPINQTERCSSFIYDTDVFETTITSDDDLVCDRNSLTTYANMIYMGGMLFGSLVMGTLSDLIGRKKTLLLCIACHVIVCFGIAFVTTYIPFVLLRFAAAFFGVGQFLTAFVIGMEIVGTKTRKFAGIIIELFWVLGLSIDVFLAYLLREWKYLQIATAIPSVFLLSYTFLMPESPRWLILKGRYKEASKVIKTIAKGNGVTLSEKVANLEHIDNEGADAKIWQMFTAKVLLIRTSVLTYNWLVASLVYYGLTLNAGALSKDVHLNFTLSAVVEGVSYIVCLFVIDRLGRKALLCAAMLLSGLACLGTMFPVMYGGDDIEWLTQTLSMVGKFGASIAFTVVFVYSAEFFPTSVRNSGLGLCSFSGRIGGIVSPYVADLGKVVSGDMGVALPLIIFGGAAFLAGVLALLLPETTNQILPETIQDAKEFGRKPKTKNMSKENLEKNDKLSVRDITHTTTETTNNELSGHDNPTFRL